MTITAEKAAQELCTAAEWSLSPLSVQKGLYIAHMTCLGQTGGKPLINRNFKASVYGPIIASLHSRLNSFGRKPVKNVFYGPRLPEDSPEAKILELTGRQIMNMAPAALTASTHHPDGAWAGHYRSDKEGDIIPNADILEEYQWRAKIVSLEDQPDNRTGPEPDRF